MSQTGIFLNAIYRLILMLSERALIIGKSVCIVTRGCKK